VRVVENRKGTVIIGNEAKDRRWCNRDESMRTIVVPSTILIGDNQENQETQ